MDNLIISLRSSGSPTESVVINALTEKYGQSLVLVCIVIFRYCADVSIERIAAVSAPVGRFAVAESNNKQPQKK